MNNVLDIVNYESGLDTGFYKLIDLLIPKTNLICNYYPGAVGI